MSLHIFSTNLCAFCIDWHYFMCYNCIIKRKGEYRMGKKKKHKQLERFLNLLIKAVAATAALIMSIAELIKALK